MKNALFWLIKLQTYSLSFNQQINKKLIDPITILQMSNSFRISDDNQFLAPNLQDSHMKGSRSMSTDQMITKLQQKNSTLKRQVTKIDRVLISMKMEDKPRYGITLPQIKPDTVKKQLQNAYKQIKIYEYQIEKRRNSLNSQSAYVEQVNKIEKVYKQKVQIHERLKREMLVLKHESKQIIKLLKNDVKKQSYESIENKLSTDIKYSQQQLRQFQQKRALHISQLEKQRASIKQMEHQILKQNSNEFLQGIKYRIFRPNNSDHNNPLSPSRSIFDIQNQTVKQESRISKLQAAEAQQAIQRTPEVFASLSNDIKLLKKMQSDYDSKISLITKERDESSQKNFRSRNKLLEIQFEIQTIEKNIQQLKKLIDPSIFKPKLPKNDQKKKQPAKLKSLQILHSYKFIQQGEITKNGKRFSDRSIIGKFNSKIVGITLYQKQQTQQFVGLQVTYKIEDDKESIKKGNLNTRLDLKKEAFQEQTLKLENEDYFKTIDLFVKKTKIIGISMVSWKNKTIKVGDNSGERVPLAMNQSQYPMCFFGSMLLDSFQCFGCQIFEQISHPQTS